MVVVGGDGEGEGPLAPASPQARRAQCAASSLTTSATATPATATATARATKISASTSTTSDASTASIGSTTSADCLADDTAAAGGAAPALARPQPPPLFTLDNNTTDSRASPADALRQHAHHAHHDATCGAESDADAFDDPEDTFVADGAESDGGGDSAAEAGPNSDGDDGAESSGEAQREHAGSAARVGDYERAAQQRSRPRKAGAPALSPRPPAKASTAAARGRRRRKAKGGGKARARARTAETSRRLGGPWVGAEALAAQDAIQRALLTHAAADPFWLQPDELALDFAISGADSSGSIGARRAQDRRTWLTRCLDPGQDAEAEARAGGGAAKSQKSGGAPLRRCASQPSGVSATAAAPGSPPPRSRAGPTVHGDGGDGDGGEDDGGDGVVDANLSASEDSPYEGEEEDEEGEEADGSGSAPHRRQLLKALSMTNVANSIGLLRHGPAPEVRSQHWTNSRSHFLRKGHTRSTPMMDLQAVPQGGNGGIDPCTMSSIAAALRAPSKKRSSRPQPDNGADDGPVATARDSQSSVASSLSVAAGGTAVPAGPGARSPIPHSSPTSGLRGRPLDPLAVGAPSSFVTTMTGAPPLATTASTRRNPALFQLPLSKAKSRAPIPAQSLNKYATLPPVLQKRK